MNTSEWEKILSLVKFKGSFGTLPTNVIEIKIWLIDCLILFILGPKYQYQILLRKFNGIQNPNDP